MAKQERPKETATVEDKKKKKKWLRIVATPLFSNREIGESTVFAPASLLGKVTSVNLMVLTNDVKKQNINVRFRVNEVKDNTGYTELISYEMIPAHVKRIVRRANDKLDDSFLAETQDGKIIRIKPLLITRTETKGSVLATLAKKSRAFVIQYVKKVSYEQLISDIIISKLQSEMYKFLKKVYPLRVAEIRALVLQPKLKKGEVPEIKAEAEPEPKKEEHEAAEEKEEENEEEKKEEAAEEKEEEQPETTAE